MSQHDRFKEGVVCYKNGQYDKAIEHFTEALLSNGDQYNIYDSRAAAFEKLGDIKAALLNAKKVIDLAPERWQGYARSARLFHDLKKIPHAARMVQLALERIKPEDSQRRTELERLQASIAESQARADAQLRKTACHIGMLPVEILAEIFALDVTPNAGRAITLSHVCKFWRRLASENPTLWRTLVLSDRQPERKLQTWLERSSCNIHSLHLTDRLPHHQYGSLMGALDKLQWERLRSFTLTCSDACGIVIRLSNGKHNFFSDLEEFEVSSTRFSDKRLEELLPQSLRAFTLNECLILTGDGGLWQHVTRLSSLTLRSSTLDIRAVLEGNPLLENVTISGGIIPHESIVPQPLSLDRLCHLDIQDCGNISRLLDQLTAPALRTVRFVGNPLDSSHLLALFPDRLTELTELRLGRCSLQAFDVIRILRNSPSLITLEVSTVYDCVNKILDFLSGSSSEKSQESLLPCPALQHVDVSRCTDLKTGPVIRFVKSRKVVLDDSEADEGSSLDSLRLDGCPDFQADCLPWLRKQIKVVSCVYMTKKQAKTVKR
ncbi:hypothetical protein CONPUDRAFT_53327 [Coniophora puteana RWD-64-598 SS2]|uniref:F-box domain-containing protein n=1 Tax=Coniophora puteana (strain RWD-64-598) TaxID=741705 RepID=A0A5M3MUG0_CONPW|nr:uncharacterized protein CONPUDRAFT_53327 [Coniophora puteana RWD-64-598 SS2]EIW82812.1 hypothetical protein CONPUDRAFT_53327 [Coniophora puteana RWD-64-598 SS2]